MTEQSHEVPLRDYADDSGNSVLPEEAPAAQHTMTESPASESELNFEELTLAQVVGRLLRHPADTLRQISSVARTPANGGRALVHSESRDSRRRLAPRFDDSVNTKPVVAVTSEPAPTGTTNLPVTDGAPRPGVVRGDGTITLTVTLPYPHVALEIPQAAPLGAAVRTVRLIFVLRLVGLVAALWGGLILLGVDVQGEIENLPLVAPFWLLGIALWIAAEALHLSPAVRALQRAEAPVEPPSSEPVPPSPLETDRLLFRLVLLVITGLLTLIALRGTAGNSVTTLGFLGWIGSMIAVTWTFAPWGWTPLRPIRWLAEKVRSIRVSISWVTVALLAIMLLAGYFRFNFLDTPPEMTSDHIEKLINAHEIINGQPRVFFTNNGGREPIQMYLLAVLAQLPFPGLGINFHTLKLLTAIEGFLSIPLMYLLGRTITGWRDRRQGELVGLALAGLVAVSYWHQILSHLGLRIVLTAAVMALLLIFLARGLRTNDRTQFILAGLTLGIGLYTYQAVRMMPLVVVAAFIIAFLHNLRRLGTIRRLFANGVVLVATAFVVFVPMLGFISEFPDDFFRRTSTRILGDEEIREVDAQGNEIVRQASLFERIGAVLPQFTENMENAFLGFNFKGDGAWFQNSPHQPFFDPYSGAFLIVGVVAWIGLMFRKRDPAIDLVLPMVVIMLLPSALAIAFPGENPSITRLSGVLPGVYLLASYAMVVLLKDGARVIGGRRGFFAAGGAAALIFLAALGINQRTFAVDYRSEYINSHYVYSEPGKILREFVETDGGWGNAYIVFFPYWWDHRGVAIEAGNIDWPHAIAQSGEENRDHIPETLREAFRRDVNDPFRYDPSMPLLFFFGDTDDETEALLLRWFPEGVVRRIETYQPNENDPFRTFYAPPMGEERFLQWLAENGSPIQ